MADTVSMPKLGFDMAEGTLVRWVIGEGEKITAGAVLAEIETDKATVEVESAYEGVVLRQLVPQGTVVPVNTPIAIIGQPGEAVEVTAQAGVEEKPTAPPLRGKETASAEARQAAPITEAGGILRASPLARRLAQEQKIDLHLVRGSGPEGRITKKDIEAFLAQPPQAPAQKVVAAVPAMAATREFAPQRAILPGEARPDRVVSLTRLRSAIARRMTEATQNIPHFFVTHEYDMAGVMELRKQINQLLPEDEKISVNDFIVKAVAQALLEFPNLNASIDLQKEEVTQHGQINVGVAVAVENGLLTVVCRDTERKSLRQIATEVRGMINRARQGRVRPEDIEGSTFTVSNLGMFAVEQFIAIINPPEAAILAIGSVHPTPAVVDGQVVPGMRMKATLSVDHRISDGEEGARFLQALSKYLEQPLRLMV